MGISGTFIRRPGEKSFQCLFLYSYKSGCTETLLESGQNISCRCWFRCSTEISRGCPVRCSILSSSSVEAVTMYSWLVTVLLLASGANSRGAQVPITSYTCTQPNIAGFLDHGQCTVSGGLRMCAIKEGARPTLLSSSASLSTHGYYGWVGNTNPFVVLDIPQGWCVESVKMTFVAPSSIPTLSLSVHSAERLSNNTDRTMFSLVSEAVTRLAVMNLTALARGKYLRINMTSTGRLYLVEIEVFGTNDSICTHPSSAGGDPASPTTSVGSSTYSVSPISTTTTGGSSLTHSPMSTSFPRDPPTHTHNAGSTDLGHSTGVTSAVFFAGLLAGVALAGPAGALSVACYHWKKKQAKTRGKNDTTSEYKEPAYDCPLQLEENPAYEAVQN